MIDKEKLIKIEHYLLSFLGSFIGIALIGIVNMKFKVLNRTDNLFLIGSFGATAVLIYGEIKSPLAQPRNVILGHFISALIGVSCAKLFFNTDFLWLASASAVSFSIVAMQLLNASHPPGGATALIATIGSEKIKSMGYLYVLNPVLSGVLILMIIALIINIFSKNRRYSHKI